MRGIFSPRPPRAAEPAVEPPVPGVLYHARGFAHALEELARRPDRLELLDLGPALPGNVAFFARRRARLHIEDLYRALPDSCRYPRRPGPGVELPAFASSALPGSCALVLVWDLLDHLPDTLITRLAERVAPLCRRDALLYAVTARGRQIPGRPCRFDIEGEDEVRQVTETEQEIPAPGRLESRLAKLLPGFEVEASFLLQHGHQEFLFRFVGS